MSTSGDVVVRLGGGYDRWCSWLLTGLGADDARQLVSVPTGFRHLTSVRLLARMTTCKVDSEVVGVVDTRDLPLTDFESVNGNLHLQLPLCNTLY